MDRWKVGRSGRSWQCTNNLARDHVHHYLFLQFCSRSIRLSVNSMAGNLPTQVCGFARICTKFGSRHVLLRCLERRILRSTRWCSTCSIQENTASKVANKFKSESGHPWMGLLGWPSGRWKSLLLAHSLVRSLLLIIDYLQEYVACSSLLSWPIKILQSKLEEWSWKPSHTHYAKPFLEFSKRSLCECRRKICIWRMRSKMLFLMIRWSWDKSLQIW